MMLLREYPAHGSLHRAFTHPLPGLLDSADVFVKVVRETRGARVRMALLDLVTEFRIMAE